jgi:hypothetical protein
VTPISTVLAIFYLFFFVILRALRGEPLFAGLNLSGQPAAAFLETLA